MNEAITVLAIRLCSGIVILLTTKGKSSRISFDEDLFFIYLLPPILMPGSAQNFKKFDLGFLDLGDCLAHGAILSAADSVCTLQALNQDETPLLYSLVFGEGVVNNATSVVLFNAILRFDLVPITLDMVIQFAVNFLYLFILSTLLGIAVTIWGAGLVRGSVSVVLAYNKVTSGTTSIKLGCLLFEKCSTGLA